MLVYFNHNHNISNKSFQINQVFILYLSKLNQTMTIDLVDQKRLLCFCNGHSGQFGNDKQPISSNKDEDFFTFQKVIFLSLFH